METPRTNAHPLASALTFHDNAMFNIAVIVANAMKWSASGRNEYKAVWATTDAMSPEANHRSTKPITEIYQ